MYININIVTRQRTAKQLLDLHPTICTRNNRTNVLSSLLGNIQHANGLARYLSRDLFSVWSALRNNRSLFSALSVSQLYNTSPFAAKERPCSVCGRYLHIRNRETRASRFQQTPAWPHCYGVMVSALEYKDQRREDSGNLFL
jgi:hypothetical protein